MAHPLLEKAAQHTAQARAINDEFEGKAMPAEAANQMKAHLDAAQEFRSRVESEARLQDTEGWLKEPDYKHDMTGGPAIADKMGHPEVKAGFEKDEAERATKAFLGYVRKGMDALSREEKADLVENATGLNLVPTDYAGTILKELPRQAVIRNLAYVRPTTKAAVDIGNVVINTAGWGKLETGTAATDGLGATPAAKDTIKVEDLNALVKLGRDELEDSDENLEAIIRDALVLKFAELEDDAFAFGTGVAGNQPEGVARNAGVTQAVTASVNATVTADDVKKLPFAVPAQFRRGDRAAFIMHTGAQQAIALLKNTDGAYMLQPSMAAAEPERLLGYRAYTVDGLPAMTATGTATDPSVVFGDFQAGYMIADRRQVSVQRLVERYADEGKIGLLFTHRVGGGVIRPKAFAKYLL
jgi:HK97 family phage major capsid protein